MTEKPNTSIAERAELDILEPAAAKAFVRAVAAAEAAGVILPGGPMPRDVFRHAVVSAIDAIETRGELLRQFLSLGPYEGDGPIPPDLAGKRLTDVECDKAIALIHSHAINCFKGQLAEILALKSFTAFIVRLQDEGRLPRSAVIFAGDAAMPLRGEAGVTKGADLHVLDESKGGTELLVVGEVKSYSASARRLKPQLEAHVARAIGGLKLAQGGREGRVVRTCRASRNVVFFSASPSRWRLPRGLKSSGPSSIPDDTIVKSSSTHWHVTLGWSHEALASQAFALTYWYMKELGRDIFSDPGKSPWTEMTPAEAGANAAKESLYYAIRRCTARSEQRAIALYNAYCFGYAIGTSFKNATGQRQMLWPEHLAEIEATGKTKDGFRLAT